MKVTRILLIAALVGTLLAGCSKDNAPENYYSWGDTKFTNIAYAGYYLRNVNEGYTFALCPQVPAECPWDGTEQLIVQIPIELMGEKIDLVDGEYNFNWYPYGEISLGGTYCWWADKNAQDLSGTGNWMKATKKAEGNFTVEINATVGGKLLKCYYNGVFVENDCL